MTRTGVTRYLAVAAAVVIVIVGAIWLIRGRAGEGDATPEGPWRAYPGAFPVQDTWQGGPRVLVPEPGGCFIGLGQDGLRRAYWRADGDCTRPVNLTPSPRPLIDGLPSEDRNTLFAAVPAHGGGYLALSRHRYHGDAFAYDTAVLRGDPVNGFKQVAEFTTPNRDSGHIGPAAIVATETGYVAVGRHNDATVAWTSPDGATWREVPMPAPPGARTSVTSVVVGPDGRLVAVGHSGSTSRSSRPAAWYSVDGGASWRMGEVPDVGGNPNLWQVVHNGQQYLAVGGVDGDQRAAALVLTSTDGGTWARDDAPAEAGARVLMAATTLPDGTVFAVSLDGEAGGGGDGPDGGADGGGEQRGPQNACAAAWRMDGAGWTREPLGCHGLPASLAVLADGRVAAVHWGTLFLRSTAPVSASPSAAPAGT